MVIFLSGGCAARNLAAVGNAWFAQGALLFVAARTPDGAYLFCNLR
jgi:hypothetical protein